MKRLTLLTLLTFTGVLLTSTAEAKEPPDADGYVPIRYYCDLGAHPSGQPNRQSGALHHRTYKNGTAESTIWLNWCWLSYQRAGPWDLYRILKHEYGHALHGYRHLEADPQTNWAYDPNPLQLCGC